MESTMLACLNINQDYVNQECGLSFFQRSGFVWNLSIAKQILR
jgi:hypothetical protein